MPDPVGAHTSTCSPAAIGGQPCVWAGVGVPSAPSNQRRAWVEKPASASTVAMDIAAAPYDDSLAQQEIEREQRSGGDDHGRSQRDPRRRQLVAGDLPALPRSEQRTAARPPRARLRRRSWTDRETSPRRAAEPRPRRRCTRRCAHARRCPRGSAPRARPRAAPCPQTRRRLRRRHRGRSRRRRAAASTDGSRWGSNWHTARVPLAARAEIASARRPAGSS